MQSHTGGWIDPRTQWEILDDFTAAGVPLHYTEFWASVDHLVQAGIDPADAEAMRAEYVGNILTVAFSHPAVEAFYFWGEITQSFGFRSDSNSQGLPTSSNIPTPTYWKVRHLLREEWMTHERLTTDTDGCVRFRGFHGDYSLRYALAEGMPAGVPFTLDARVPGRFELTVHRAARDHLSPVRP